MDAFAYILRLTTLADAALAEEFRKQTAETAGAIRAEIVVRWLRTVQTGSRNLRNPEACE